MRAIIAPPRGRAARLLVFLLLVATVSLPSAALACGVFIPSEGDGYIAQERALITWDGQTEEIIMELAVTGEAGDAAWIVPLPSPAEVELSDSAIFDALQEYTKPELKPRYQLFPNIALAGSTGEGVGAGAPPVSVLNRQKLGALDVATLAATDAGALAAWLDENGFNFPEEVSTVLQAYVDMGWYFVAMRIAPDAASPGLGGRLDPVKMSFASDEIIYPVRPAGLSPNSLLLVLYVLTDHRVSLATLMPGLQPDFAGWLTPDSVGPASPLAPFAGRQQFLTKFEEVVWDTTIFSDDIRFELAPDDATYRQVEYYDRWLYELCLACLCLPFLFAAGFIVFLAVKRSRQPKPGT